MFKRDKDVLQIETILYIITCLFWSFSLVWWAAFSVLRVEENASKNWTNMVF